MLNHNKDKTKYLYTIYEKSHSLCKNGFHISYLGIKIIRYAENRCVRYALKLGDAECQQA